MQRFLEDAQTYSGTAGKAQSGEAADAFRAYVKHFVGLTCPPAKAEVDEPLVTNLVAACSQLAKACAPYTDHVEAAKEKIQHHQNDLFAVDMPWDQPMFGANGYDGGACMTRYSATPGYRTWAMWHTRSTRRPGESDCRSPRGRHLPVCPGCPSCRRSPGCPCRAGAPGVLLRDNGSHVASHRQSGRPRHPVRRPHTSCPGEHSPPHRFAANNSSAPGPVLCDPADWPGAVAPAAQ
ncbi:hypothetical protein [Streptomyces xantholiticus]